MRVAALYVDPKGVYAGLPDVEVWDQARDARTYAGPWPVVAHPPCARWCRLAGLVESLGGNRRGEDGGCFQAALCAVQRWGGVLEHPAWSDAWPVFGLPTPQRGAWTRSLFGEGWVTEVWQRCYGHRARKATWLYAVVDVPPPLDWSTPAPPEPLISWCGKHGDNIVSSLMGTRERNATPDPFRDLLLSIARSVRLEDPA